MKAAILYNFNQDFKIEETKPKGVGVKVNVAATGICGRDIVIWKGGFRNLKTPIILGHEIVGYYKDKPVAVYPNINCGKCEYCKKVKKIYATIVLSSEKTKILLADMRKK